MAENWIPIEIQFWIWLDLNSWIFTLNNLLSTELKIKRDTWHKLRIQLKFNWIFSKF